MQNKNQIQAYVKQPDYTAYELYRKEHPEKTQSQALTGFVLMTIGVMGCFLGGAYVFSHPEHLIMPLMLAGGFFLVRRFK